MAAIPLHCNICPKKPNFSDVSHLLTHIASKGHLSNYYKVKVRSSSEEASRRLIEAYDRWYAEWNVEELMSERMNQKDKRRTRARPAGRANPSAPPDIQAPARQPPRPQPVGNLLDPRLSEHQLIKLERPCTPTPTPQPGPALRLRPFVPGVQYWSTASRSASTNYTNPDYETSSEYSDQSMPKPRSRYIVEDTCAIEDDPADPAGTEDPMAVSEATKLKGILWPGMDLFDAATPEMRRKRNQKKDSSVLEQLELNSLEVEANELIFTPQGSLKKKRRISSSEFDLLEEESSPPPVKSPKLSRTRPVLGSLDVNSRRRPRQGVQAPALPYPKRSHGNAHNRPAPGHGERTSRGKRNLAVYVDDDEDPFGQPAPINYLSSSYRRASPPSAPLWSSYKPYNDLGPFDTSNKENILPAYPQGCSDHHHPHAGGYHYHPYSFGLGQEQHAFQYREHLYVNNPYRQQHLEDADDQRTVTAPPSPIRD